MKINCIHWADCDLINGGCCKKNKYAGKPSYGICITVCEIYQGNQKIEEFKEFYQNSPKKSKGLGDTLEKIFVKTGIKKIAHKILGKECGGCKKRQKKLNEKFPYKKGENENEN